MSSNHEAITLDPNRVIRYYRLDSKECKIKLQMPVGARTLSAQSRGTEVWLFAEVDIRNENTLTERTFYLFHSNEPMPRAAWHYVGTVADFETDHIHVYESL